MFCQFLLLSLGQNMMFSETWSRKFCFDIPSSVSTLSPFLIFISLLREKKKLVARFLRFIAHTHGASLVFVSNKDDLSNAKV